MKRIIYTLACLMLSVGAWAQTSLQEQINNATDGATITLTEDVTLSEQVEVNGKNITIDLNGKTISYSGSALSSGILLVHNGAGLTINATDGGAINSGIAMAAIALTKKGDDASQPAKLVVNGGTITGGNYGITGNGTRPNTEITINGGTITATIANDNFGIYHPQDGKLTITGGSITAYSAAIEMRAGTLDISGGTFTSTATEYSCNPNSNGTTTVGAAIAIAQHTTKKDINVSISGGTFTGVKAINESNPQANDPAPQVQMAITDGKFNGEISTVDVNGFVKGGTFSSAVPEDYCASGYIPTDDGEGHYGVKTGSYVAQIGETKYESLQEAMSAATASSIVKLLADVKLSTKLEVTCSDVTLDLNGKTISPADDNTVHDYCIVMVHRGAKLTVDDSSAEKTGCIDGGTDTNAFYGGIQLTQGGDNPDDAKAILVVNNGTIKGNVAAITGNGNRHNTEITINGGTFIASSTKVGDEGCAIYHPQDGTLTINGGTFTGYGSAVEMRSGTLNITGGEFTATATEFTEKANGNGVTVIGAALAVSQHKTNKDINVSISGGTFNGQKAVYEKDYQDSSSDNIAIAISGGTFNAEVSSENVQNFISGGTFKNAVPEEYCAVGFIPQDNGDGTYGVTEKDYVAKIGDNKYESLAEAIEAAHNGEIVTLLANTTENITIPAGKNITLDLNGKTLNGKQTANTPTIKNLGTLTVKNGNVRRSGDGSASWYIVENEGTIIMDEGLNVEGSASSSLIHNNAATAQMTFNAGTYTQTGAFIVVKNDLGNVVINGGTFTTASDKNVLNNWNQMTINGGSFTGNILNGANDTEDSKLTINNGTFDTNKIRTYIGNGKENSPIEIKGGTFTNSGMVYANTTNTVNADDVQVAVSGGTFANPVPEKYCADGFIPKDKGDGTYTVKTGSYVAQIGDVKYESLSEAIAAATADATITLIADINESVTNSNTNSFTIDLNDKNWISSGDAFKNNGGTVTFTGDGLVKSTAADGVAVWARLGSVIINGGNYENCSNEEATVYVGTTNEKLGDNKPTATINGGTFKNTADGVYKYATSLLPLTLNVHNDISDADAYQAIVINGGKFFGNDPSIGDDKQMGKINNNSIFVAPNLHAEKVNGVFEIKPGGYVAQTGYIKYVTLDDAIDARPETETTIYLLANAETTKDELPANITIDARSNQLTMHSFVVLDGQAFTLPKITGAVTYKVKKATYKRTNVSTTVWGTVCLPFSLTSGNGANYYIYKNIYGSTLTVDETTETVAPHTPVVFSKAAGDLTINETNATVSLVTPETLANGALVGTYTARNVTANGSIYFINGDTFHKAQVSVKVPMYRAYIDNSSSSGAKPSVLSIMVADNTATSIEALDADATVSAIYDASGRKISAPQKGMNIMKLANGKTIKVMMK